MALAAAALAVCSISACRGGPETSIDAPKQEAPLAVTVMDVAVQPVDTRVDITGTLAGWDEAVVSVEVEGRIVELNADLGDRVRKGQVLLKINPIEYELSKTRAEADYADAEGDFKRSEALYAKKLIAEEAYSDARKMLAFSKTSVELARKKLDDTSLKAPFDGVVAKRMVNAGEYIRGGTAAFYIVRTSPLKFKGDVPERYSGVVRSGDTVLAYAEGRPDDPLKGALTRVGVSVSTDTRSFPVEAKVENPGESVKPGTFCRLSIITGHTEQALTVPDNAVFQFAGNPRVFVMKDGKAVERVVEISGKTAGSRVVISKGLVAGDKVIVTSVDKLADGRPVTARE